MNLFDLAMAKKMFGGSGGGAGGDSITIKQLAEVGVTELSSEDVEFVKWRAFDTWAVKTVDFPNATTINDYGFTGCYALVNVNLPAVKTVYDYVFDGCYLLESISLPKAETIGVNAFAGCTKLKNVDMPSLFTIGNGAFDKCVAMESVNFPLVSAVGVGAFMGCDELRKVDFGSEVSIGELVFSGCDKLEAVIFRTTDGVCMATPDSLTGSPLLTGTAFVYIHASMWDAYTAVYGIYMSMFRKIEDYPEICG